MAKGKLTSLMRRSSRSRYHWPPHSIMVSPTSHPSYRYHRIPVSSPGDMEFTTSTISSLTSGNWWHNVNVNASWISDTSHSHISMPPYRPRAHCFYPLSYSMLTYHPSILSEPLYYPHLQGGHHEYIDHTWHDLDQAPS